MKVQIKRLDSVTHNDTTATKLINDNFKAIQDEIELHLSRDGKEPNFMNADLDMNSYKIINSAYPTEDIDVATKEYVDDVVGNAAEYAAQASASAARAAESEQHAAVYAQVAEDARAQVDEILPIIDHLNEIDTVSNNIAPVNTVSTNIDNVNRVAPHADKLSQLDDDVEQLLKQINGEGSLDSMVSGDNVTQATMSARGTARFATDSEVQAGTSTDVMITPKQLKQYGGGSGSSVDTYTKTEIDSMFNNVGNSKVNVDADNFTAIGKSAIADILYPVGSIYIGVQTECPLKAVIQGSEWVKVSAGRVLQGSDSSHAADTTIAAGLPNITGNVTNVRERGMSGTDAFNGSAQTSTYKYLGSADGGQGTIKFSAKNSNSIYGNSTTVQPPAYVVNIWKRTA